MKNKQLHIRLTEDEFAFIKAKSKKANMTMTDFLMESMKKKKIVVLTGYKEIFDEVRRIGNNINQIAKSWNMGLGEQSDMVEIQRLLEEIWRLLRSASQKTT